MNVVVRTAHSLAFRVALVPLIGLVIALTAGSGLAGLAASIAAAMAVLATVRLEDWRRREREKREHIAGLGRW
jgi:hypothetical protein